MQGQVLARARLEGGDKVEVLLGVLIAWPDVGRAPVPTESDDPARTMPGDRPRVDRVVGAWIDVVQAQERGLAAGYPLDVVEFDGRGMGDALLLADQRLVAVDAPGEAMEGARSRRGARITQSARSGRGPRRDNPMNCLPTLLG